MYHDLPTDKDMGSNVIQRAADGAYPTVVIPSAEVPIDTLDHPHQIGFLDYWRSLKGDRLAPAWEEFDLMALDLRSIPHVAVVDVVGTPLPDFIYRFWGTAHVRQKGVDKTSKSVLDPPQLRGSAAFDEYTIIVAEKRPLAARGMVEFPHLARTPFLQTVLHLPLSGDGETVDKIATLAHWAKNPG